MATLKQCDRCGKIVNPIYFLRYQHPSRVHEGDESSFSERELCLDCTYELFAFMRGERTECVTKEEVKY